MGLCREWCGYCLLLPQIHFIRLFVNINKKNIILFSTNVSTSTYTTLWVNVFLFIVYFVIQITNGKFNEKFVILFFVLFCDKRLRLWRLRIYIYANVSIYLYTICTIHMWKRYMYYVLYNNFPSSSFSFINKSFTLQ